MLATFISKTPTFKTPLRPPDLPVEPFLGWIALIVVWAGLGWLAHCYMMHDLKKQRPLRQDDADLVWTCMVVAPFAAFIAFLMFLVPEHKKRGQP